MIEPQAAPLDFMRSATHGSSVSISQRPLEQSGIRLFRERAGSDAFRGAGRGDATNRSARITEILTTDECSTLVSSMQLSRREAQVLFCILENESVTTTAHRLGVSVHTVGTYRERLFRKCGAVNSADMISIVFSRYAQLIKRRGETGAEPLRQCSPAGVAQDSDATVTRDPVP